MKKRDAILSIFSYWARVSTSAVVQALTFYLSHIQLIAILIQIQASIIFSAQKDPFSAFTTKLADILALNSFFQDNYKTWIHSFFLVCTWIYLTLLVGSFSYIGIQNLYRKTNGSRSGSFVACILQLHYGVVFWITARILIIPWVVEAQGTDAMSSLNITNKELAIINFPFLVVTFLIAGIGSFMCIDYFSSNNQFAIIRPTEQNLILMSKALLVMCLLLKDSGGQTIYIILLMIVLFISLLRHYLLFRTVPYQSYQTMKLSVIWSCLESCLLAINAITSIIGERTSDKSFTIFYAVLLILPWIMKYNIAFFDKNLERYSTVAIDNLNTETQVYKKMLSWKKLIEPFNQDNKEDSFSIKSRLYFLGLLNDHITECKKQKCGCNSLKKCDLSKFTQEKTLFEKVIEILFSTLLEESVKRIKDSQNLRLNLVNEVLKSQNNEIIKAFSALNAIPKESSFFVKVKRNILFWKLQHKLDTSISQLEEGDFDIKKVIDFHNEKRLCSDLLASNTRKFINFWSYYTQPNFMLVELLNKSIAIEKEADRIDHLFENYMSKYSELTHLLGGDYHMYLTLIRNRPTAAMKFREKHLWRKKNEKRLTNPLATFSDDPFSSDSTILYISMSKGKKGKIVYVSFDGSKDALNYEKKDLLSQDMNILLPPSFRERHFQLMSDPLQLAEIVNTKVHELESYVFDKDGFLVPCFIRVAIFPRIQEDLTYACILSQKKTSTPFMMFNEEGLMQGMSRGINEKSGFSLLKKTYMKDICDFDTEESRWQKLPNFSQRFDGTISEERNLGNYEGRIFPQTIMKERVFILQVKQDQKVHIKQNLRLQIDHEDSDFPDIPDESPAHAKQINSTSRAYPHTEHKTKKLNIKDLPTSPKGEDLITMFSERSEKGAMLKNTLENESFLKTLSDRKVKNKNTLSLTTSRGIASDVKSQLEYGAYKVPSNKLMRSINTVVGGILIMCIIFLYICGQVIHDRLIFTHHNSEILNVATIRLQLIVQLGRNLVYRNFLNEGLIKNDRYLQAFGKTSFKDSYPSPRVREQTLNVQNTLLRKLFDQIDENLQEEAYNYMVPLIDDNSQIFYKNIFDAAIELTLKAKKLTANPAQLNAINSSNIMFVLRNSFDEILIGSERISDIVLKDNMKNLDQLTDIILYLLIGICIFGLVPLALFVQRQSRLISERTKIINLFLMIRDQDINDILSKAVQFEQVLTLSEMKDKNSPTTNYFLKNSSAKISHNYQKKTFSSKNLNLAHFMITLLGFTLYITMLLPFLANYLLINNKISFFKNKLESIVNVNTHPYEMQLLHSSLCYHFDPSGLTKLRTRPFEEEWEALFQRRSNASTIFFDLLQTLENENICSKPTIQSLNKIITGNVCDPFAATWPDYNCTTMAGGASLRGILGMASYTLSTLRSLKDRFDHSNKTNAALTEILDSEDNVYAENMVTSWHILALNKTTTLLLECNNAELTSMQGKLDIYWALYILAYAFIAMIVSYLWSRIIDRESAGWKKLMRKIPLEIIHSQNALKLYIQKEWNKISKSS